MSQQFRSAVHLFFIDDDQVLLSRRANTGYMDGHYSVVAGHLEPGETVLQAAVREASEEAGVVILPKDTEVVGVMHRRDGEERIDFFARVHSWVGEPFNAEPEKCSDLRWFRLNALPENIVPYIFQALQNYKANVWFDTFGF
ncbi:MAG: NUDIX domain-containing protein [Anaerolineales bacterium]|nr:NUDIX domain-containing protein [Anaerolineales bacterium]